MLFDPKWEVETKADVFSLESLIAWLEKQPADRHYNFNDCEGSCLLGQYIASTSTPWSLGLYEKVADGLSGRKGGYFPIGYEQPHTFGGALSRAREALVSSHHQRQ